MRILLNLGIDILCLVFDWFLRIDLKQYASPPQFHFLHTMLSLSLVLGLGADNVTMEMNEFLSYETPRIEAVSTQYSRELQSI